MIDSGRMARWLFVALAAALGPAVVHCEPDVLDRPSLMSWRAQNSAMIAVTRAGARLVAVGERGIVLLSDDGGNSWRQGRVPVSVTLTNVRFVGERIGWAVGHGGIVLRSDDGGQTWTKQLDGKLVAALALDAAKANAERLPNDVRVRRQLADAERLVADGADKPFLDLWFFNQSDGFVVGAYGLMFGTSDGGRSWHSWLDRIDNPKGHHLYAIDAVGGDLYLAGEQGTLYHSTDAGQTFSAVPTPYGGSFFGVRHLDDGAVLVFGLRGNAYRRGEGGRDWHKLELADESGLNAAARMEDGSIVLVDQSGRLLRSRDEARSFVSEPTGVRFPLAALCEAADGSIVLAGLGGVAKVPAAGSDGGSKR